jgi:RNA polymerase sigma factor (sigma-70 family)
VRANAPSLDAPDSTLIHRFLGGDERAFRALYRRHTPRLRMVVWRLLAGNDADTDDVVQETWIAGCRGLHAYRGDSQFGTWLTTIGVRTARRRLTLREDTGEPLPDDWSSDAPALAEGIDIERGIARLSDQHRAVLVLHDVEGFTHEEIAAQLGVATGTSKAALSRARAKLRRYLNGEVTHGR